MTDVYLFDWGDTLMVDFPGVPGKMCDWDTVKAVEGAEDVLNFLSQKAEIYVATGAAESTEVDIESAFKRVGLARYISGYFCKSNLDIEKGHPAFLPSILKKLHKRPGQVTMVGDSLEKDIEPAQMLGINTIWLSRRDDAPRDDRIRKISSLKALCP